MKGFALGLALKQRRNATRKRRLMVGLFHLFYPIHKQMRLYQQRPIIYKCEVKSISIKSVSLARATAIKFG